VQAPRGGRGGSSAEGDVEDVLFPVDDSTWGPAAGRVVDERGEPVVGARVAVSGSLLMTRPTSGASSSHRADLDAGRAASGTARLVRDELVTGADGTFELDEVPTSGVVVRLIHPSGTLRYVRATTADDESRVDHVLPGAAWVQVEGTEEAEAFTLVDGAGEVLELAGLRGPRRIGGLSGGRSGWLAVAADAAELHLLRDGETVQVVPVSVVSGSLNPLLP